MKRLCNILLLAGLLLGGHLRAVGQVFEWARLARGSSRPLAGATGGATDRLGNTYVAITFRDTLHLGSQTLLAGAGTGAVVKYDSTGQVQWARQLRGLYLQNGVAVDPAGGGVFLLGQAQAGAAWAGVPVTVSTAGSFYAKCTAAGALQWVLPLPALYGASGNQAGPGPGGALAADGLGNCYVMGNVRVPTQLQGVALDSAASVLLQANPAGAIQWVRTLRTDAPGASRTRLENLGLAGNAAGGCTLTGYCNSQVYFDSVVTPFVSTANGGFGNQASFIGQVSPAGAMRWAQPAPVRAVGSSARGVFYDIATDGAGNSYGTGVFGNDGFGIVKYDGNGVEQWVRAGTSGGGPTAGFALTADRAGNTTVGVGAGPRLGSIAALTIGPLVVRGTSLVRFSPQGQPLWAVPFAANSGPSAYLRPAACGTDEQGNAYYAANVLTSLADSVAARPATVLGTHTLVGRGVVLARLDSRHNTIGGLVYLDQNGNGRPDAGDVPLAQPAIVTSLQTGNSYFATPDADGQYRLYVGPGAYTAVAPPALRHYALSQPSSSGYAGSFAGYGRSDTARHFGYRPIPNQTDIRLTLTPYGAARPGFLSRYRLTLENVGTTAVAGGTATVALDAHMAYVSSTPAATRSGQTLTWAYASLAPFARREFDVLFSLPVNTPLGTVLGTAAAAPLPADVVPADNSTTAAQTVTGSFDPNDIQVNYARLTPAQVAAGQPLDYTIRFQNMGTDTAFTVVIQDTLRFRKLDLSTLQLVAQSHNCRWSLAKNGELVIRFLNVRLPQRGIDVIRSQGFVRFRVLPRATLAVGDIIPNRAHIVFDYNDPVRTNTVATAVLLPTAAAIARPGLAWDVYPNPATAAFTIAATLPTGGPVNLRLLDALGRPVRQQRLVAPAGPLRETLALQGLAPGIYILQMTLPGGTESKRVVVE